MSESWCLLGLVRYWLGVLTGSCVLQIALGPGVVVSVRYKAVSELLPNGMKEGAFWKLILQAMNVEQHHASGQLCQSAMLLNSTQHARLWISSLAQSVLGLC